MDGFQVHGSEDVPQGSIGLRVQVAADNPYFRGHFPGKPVLPGIVQLMMVERLLKTALGDGCQAVEFRRVRFSAPIGPRAELRVEVTRSGTAGHGSFRIESNGSQACRGLVVWQVDQ